jgi:uncharacterized protein (UPF0212 family)
MKRKLERVLHHVKLNQGEIACPYCHVTLIMDSVLDTDFMERQCPSCKNDFFVVSDISAGDKQEDAA